MALDITLPGLLISKCTKKKKSLQGCGLLMVKEAVFVVVIVAS